MRPSPFWHSLCGLFVLTAVTTVWGDTPASPAHWAFRAPVRPAVPAILNPKIVLSGANGSKFQNPVDAFILGRLRSKGLTFSPEADRRTLIRRLTFDLTGLPPAPDETAAFVADRSPHAYEKVVARLLASKHFGERWAQHWLDVVRFAESNGYEHDLDRPQAWRYRDWVVNALNADMPYDRFVQLQVAGDLLAPNDFEARVATGFLRAGPFHITGGNLDPKEMRQEWLTEAVAGIGNGILGLTIGCARCHNHKIDPVPQADYYRLQAFFTSTANNDFSGATEAEKKKYDEDVKANKDRQKPIDAEIAAIEKPYREKIRAAKMEKLAPEYKAALAVEASKRTAEQKKLAGEAGTQLNVSWDEVVNALSPEDRSKRAGLRQKIFAIEREAPTPLPQAQGVGEDPKLTDPMRILVRGDVHNPGDVVQPGYPECLATVAAVDTARRAGPSAESAPATRLDLARWLTSPDNPLTTRVIVNRAWHYLFGRGIVSTPNDYGKKGSPPSHPELLDWLACEFRDGEGGGVVSGNRQDTIHHSPITTHRPWSLKRLITFLVTSQTYRQACLFDPKKAAIDPDNRLLWRANRKRLDAEAIRDATLQVSGALNPQMGGPSIRIPLEPEVYDTIFTEYEPDNLWEVAPDPRQHVRRSLYLFRKRNVRLPMLTLFDQPDLMTSCAARGQTVHALQALTLINGQFMRAQSELLARRLLGRESLESQKSRHFANSVKSADSVRITRLFDLALGRPPRADEKKATEKFLAGQIALLGARSVPDAEAQAWSDLCLATLNLNEFVYLR